jgi:hypothetical protein
MYDLDETAKRECVIWDAEHSPQHDSYVTRDLAIKEETLFSITFTTMKTLASCESGWPWCKNSATTVEWFGRPNAEHQRAIAL